MNHNILRKILEKIPNENDSVFAYKVKDYDIKIIKSDDILDVFRSIADDLIENRSNIIQDFITDMLLKEDGIILRKLESIDYFHVHENFMHHFIYWLIHDKYIYDEFVWYINEAYYDKSLKVEIASYP